MAGLPASGKSTLCRKLAAKLNGIVLDEDKIRSALFSQADIEYSTTQDDFCMKVALEAAGYILRKNPGRFVSVDGRPFSRTYQLEQVLQAARDFNQEWRILECVCSEETARKTSGGTGSRRRTPGNQPRLRFVSKNARSVRRNYIAENGD